MSHATICNVHQRRIEARPEQVWDLLMAMSGPDDQLWPDGVPALRFDGPLAVGAQGGHGPIRYQLTSLDETTGIVFRFQEPTGLVGHHSFHVLPDGKGGTVLRHELVARSEGWMRVQWPLVVRWVHDAVLEELLDRAELGTGHVPAHPHQRSPWVRSLLSWPARPCPRWTGRTRTG